MARIDRAFAKQLIDAARSLDVHLNKLHEVSEELPDDLKRQVRRELGEVMGRVYTDIMLPMIREYPELDPDK